MSGHLHFAEAPGRDLLDLDELLFVSGNVDLGDTKSLGRKDSILNLLHGLDGLVAGVVAVVSQVPEMRKLVEMKQQHLTTQGVAELKTWLISLSLNTAITLMNKKTVIIILEGSN